MQSHSGLGQYTAGAVVTFSQGNRFADSRAPLFPVLREMAEWSGEAEEDNSGGTSALLGRSLYLVDTKTTQEQRGLANAEIQKAHRELAQSEIQWQDAAIVDGTGQVRVRRHPTRRYRTIPSFMIPVGLAKGVQPAMRVFPDSFQAPTTHRPQMPSGPSRELQLAVKRDLETWEDCITAEAKAELQRAASLVDTDEKRIRSGTPLHIHRQRAKCGKSAAEVRIGPDRYHPTVIKALQQGFTIDLTDGGEPKIRSLVRKQGDDWGINAEQLLRDARDMGWPDEELLFFLEFGFMDYSGGTPPICSFSPHQQKAITNLGDFKEQVSTEISEGWMGPPLTHPPSVPFQIRPGSIEPKAKGTFRLVWNASWPAPGSYKSAVEWGGKWQPVAPNSSTRLPSGLEFEWGAIETNNEAIAIMAEGAKAAKAAVLGRTFDISKWFRQLATASLDLWKCVIYSDGHFREDLRMQMGRRSSAHSAQRATFLITALLQRAAYKEKWGLPEETEQNDPSKANEHARIAAWFEERKATLAGSTGNSDMSSFKIPPWGCPVYFSSFQDDITVVALGEKAARDATVGVNKILGGRYGVPLSTKEEASREFARVFTSIGAQYDLSDLTTIRCMPRPEKVQKYRSMISELKKSFPLVTLIEMQRFAGLHTFVARFLRQGEFYCNSAYVCLRASTQTAKNLRPISRDLIRDAETVVALLERGEVAPLTADPVFAHPGRQGLSADACGATGADDTGWGVHIHGHLASGKWSADIKQALKDNVLSISPLELLAAAIALRLAGREGMIHGSRRQIVIESDSESTCTVVNSMRADSAAMLEALRIFREVQDQLQVEVRMQHIPTEENYIAEKLSRGRYLQAAQEAARNYVAVKMKPPAEIAEWSRRIVSVAKKAARHAAQP